MKYLWLAAIVLVFACAAMYPTQKAKIDHGDYLANRASICLDCHTPKDTNGKFEMSKSLQGVDFAKMMKNAKPDPKRATKAPDLTKNGLAGKWGQKAMVNFLITGMDSEGDYAKQPMPAYRFNRDDAESLYAYMMTLPKK